MKMKAMLMRAAVVTVIGLAGIGVYFSRCQWIPAGHVGVIYDASGGLRKQVIPPRRVFVPWMSQLYVYPTMVKAAIYTNDPSQGEVKSSDAIQVTTNDNANTPFDVVVWYSVKPENVHLVFSSFRAIPIEDIQAQHIRAAVREAVNSVGPDYDTFELMGPKRGEASKKMLVELKKLLERKGITVDSAEFAGAYPSPEIMQRITSRVNSLTELKISEIRRQIAGVQRDTAVIKATAQAKAQHLASAQTKDRSLELLRLEADMAALEKWSGHLPPIQTKPGQTVVVSPEMISSLQGGQK
ncbi:MAG: spfh domain / band 7 family protein [Armatimonadetes bacterium]|jgi:regulator of protease activity HflC (stomatin/prohibitin superfamily)|nr:spfh domain / band 7 family protein [Armatimonadota bacterium]